MKADSDLLLFDCGEGSQRQMIRYGTGFAVDAVFFTHFHADHYLGIIGFLRTLGMRGREHAAARCTGPPPAKRLLDQAVHLGVERLAFPVEIDELKRGDSVRPRRLRRARGAASITASTRSATCWRRTTRPGRFDPETGARRSECPRARTSASCSAARR